LEVILDTNALSAFADGDPPAVAEVRRAADVAIPAVVLGEFLFGTASSRREREYAEWLKGTLRWARVLDISSETASEYARVRAELKHIGKPIPANDLWIAALCRQHYQPLLSRDQHFEYVPGLRRIGW
jgi:tRNA(fMet)-specific endonuclease VapC